MDITAYIRELLFSHDCVIIPGFGGFIGNYSPARIDKSISTFYPPVKQISFNRNLNHNDGLLVGKISESSGLNYGDARNLVDEFVNNLRKRLEKGEKIVFENIGTFQNNQEGSLQFEPDHNVNYHLDSYGLDPFQFSPLEAYDIRKRIIKYSNKEPVRHPAARKIIWRAAVAVPLIALMIAVPLRTDIFKSKAEASNLNPLAKTELENNRKAVDKNNDIEIIPSEETEIIIPENTISSVTSPVESVQPVETESINYYLITGSFQLKENADHQANILRAEGFNPEVITAPNGFFRVSAMRCNDINAALSNKEILSEKYPGTWIRKQRPI
jgi:nucleoid DNA-binding protein